MQQVQVPLVRIARQEDIQGLRLADLRRPVGGQFDHPALIKFESGLEDILLVVGEAVKVLDRALVLQDRAPRDVGVQALLGQDLLQVGVLHRERAGQGLVGIDVGGDRLDAGGGSAADDRNRGGGRDGQFVAETLHHPALLGVRAGSTLFGELARRLVGLPAKMLEKTHVPGLGQGALEGHVLGLQERMEAHQPQAHRSFALGGVARRLHGWRRAINEILQHIVQEAQHILDEGRMIAPFHEHLGVHR